MKTVIQIIAIVAVLTLGVVVGWKILYTARPVTMSEGGSEEHGEHQGGSQKEHGGNAHIELTEAQIKNAGITLKEAGPKKIRQSLRLFGHVGPNEERLAHIMPRYPGIVKKVYKKLGESVQKGEVLAIIESNESLQPYEVKSEIAGTVAEKHITLGELVSTDKVFTIADLSTVWVNLNVYRQDFPKVRVGQKVFVDRGAGEGKVESEISYISAFGSESTQTMLARAVIPNADGQLRPGLFIEGNVVLDLIDAPIAVSQGAVQTMEGKPVVFVREGDGFEVRPVQIGLQDDNWIEITAGLRKGEKYVATNSFVLKSEAGKAGAAHEH